jgi:hypothetical protein
MYVLDIVYVMHFSEVTLLFEQWIIFKILQFIRWREWAGTIYITRGTFENALGNIYILTPSDIQNPIVVFRLMCS